VEKRLKKEKGRIEIQPRVKSNILMKNRDKDVGVFSNFKTYFQNNFFYNDS